jgi:lipopolysaccharide biosynthesis regulator YciM
MQGRDFTRARGIAEAWALGNPADAGPQFSLANVFRATGEIERAIGCYRRVLELVPEGPVADRARSEIAGLRAPR